MRGASVLVAALAVSVPARAAPPATARLAYVRGHGAERCPGDATLRGAVAERLGYDPFRDDAPRLIAARVEQVGGALGGEVTLYDPAGKVAGTRKLVAANDDCADLVATMALAISIAVDPDVLFRPAPVARPPRAPDPPSASPAPPPASAPASAPAPPRASTLPPPSIVPDPLPVLLEIPPLPPPARVRFHAGIGGLVAAGTAPAVNGGFTAQLGLRYGAFSAAIEGRADVPAATSAPGGGTVSGALYAGSFVPCFHARVFAACGLVTAGGLRGAGSGVADARTDVTPFAALGLRAGVEIPLVWRVALDVHGDFTAALTPTTLRLDGRDVWTTPRAAGALGAGVLVHFP